LPEVGDRTIDQFYVAVGKKIRTVRNEAGLSQTVLARQIGFNRSSIANLEAGRQRIALHLFALIAQALDTEPATLLPDMRLLEDASPAAIDNLNRHLAGTSETTQDFVRGTVAQVTSKSHREGN
jgi:transcriptional regulator with XRE-family HTH domain